MGITGLLPFLEKSTRQINVSQYAGCTVAVDTYCWLHKGAFSCADKLARGDKTDVYVNYCMKFVNMLLSHNIKPIMVFDGRHLPAKADTEKKRRQNREMNRRRAAELLRLDKPNEARTYLQRCIDVTHTMALELMRECRSRNVDCITAPFEADAQLAYLNLNNIAHIVITEDSDLLLFGCSKVIFKLDMNGNGLLVEQERLHVSMGLSPGCFSLDKFRHMCILSGCDYLASLPKIGLAKACRFVKSTVDPDIHRALSRLGGHLNMNIVVPLEYRNKFLEAEAMFRHQPAFDPLTRRLVPLTPVPPGAPSLPIINQEPLSTDQLLQLAYGNLDPFTLEKLDDWAPEKSLKNGIRTNSWSVKHIARHPSIWSSDFKPKALVIEKPDLCKVKRSSTSGKVVERSVEVPKLPVKRPLQSTEEELKAMREQFGGVSPHPSKKQKIEEEELLDLLEQSETTPPKTEATDSKLLESPRKAQANPFSKVSPPSGNKFSGLSKLAQFRKTTVSDTNIVQSRYFGGNSYNNAVTTPEDSKVENKTLKDYSNVIEKLTPSCEKTAFLSVGEKLTDNSIRTVLSDSTDNVKKERETVNCSSGKENVAEMNKKLKRENTFRWKSSLEEMFGFRSKSLPSTPEVSKDSVILTNDLVKSDQTNKCNEENISVDQSYKRNPFAKVKKIEESSFSFGSQGSSLSKDSESDILTPEATVSQDSVASTSSTVSSTSTTAKPQMKVGLSKKQSSASCQRSLLSMFAFKPKPKLQR